METIVTNIFDREMTILTSAMLRTDEQNGYNIQTTTIGEFVDPQRQQKHLKEIQTIRELCPTLEEKLRNKGEVDALKKSLPAGIVSGVAEGGIGAQSVKIRNGVAQFDIDVQDNPQLYDWEAVKTEISKSPFVAYAGLSVSGLGVWGMIAIEDAMKYKQHIDAIARDFATTTFSIKQGQDIEPTVVNGIILDPAPSNVASKRFLSFDPHPYCNTSSQVYTKTIEPVQLYERRYTASYTNGFDIEQFFLKHGIEYTKCGWNGGTKYIVTCPWVSLHSCRSKTESAVLVSPEGVISYRCMHAHCTDKRWRHYREYYEPDAVLL